jgi:hypothetical protein
MFANLNRLRAAGAYRAALAYHDLGTLRARIGWEHEPKPADLIAALDPNGSPAPWPDIQKYTAADAATAASSRTLVQWDNPIPPPEAYAVLGRMAAFKEASVYKVGDSYLGKEIWAMDLMPPVGATHWSQAKQTTMKPTVVYSARQHANEVSSTSHVLKLAELLLTDSAYRDKLNKVNVVIHPITNPTERAGLRPSEGEPNYAARRIPGSLGVDVVAGNGKRSGFIPRAASGRKSAPGCPTFSQPAWLPDTRMGAAVF